MKWNRKAIVWFAFLCFVVGSIGIWKTLQTGGGLSKEDQPLHMEKSADARSLENLSVSTDTADITLTPGDTNEVKVVLSGTIPESRKTDVSVNMERSGANELKVTVRTQKKFQVGLDLNDIYHWFQYGFDAGVKVEVSLPDKIYKSLKLTTDTGRAVLPSIQSDSLAIETDTGNISIGGFKGNKLQASSDTGKIKIGPIEGAAAEIESDTGAIALDVASFQQRINVRSDTGSISITADPSLNAQLDFQSDTGKTAASLPDVHYDEKEKHRLLGHSGTGGPLLKVRSDTGNITLDAR